MKKRVLVCAGLLLVCGQAIAAKGRHGEFYVGGGMNYNDLDYYAYDEALGFQFFGGYDFHYRLGGRINTAVEVGYMNSGDFDNAYPYYYRYRDYDVDGLWATGVFSLPVNSQFEFLGRLGLDFGEDDGVMAGIGAGFGVGRKADLRVEYVVRDVLDSLQANFVLKF